MFVNGLVTFLDVQDRIDLQRFGPGRLEDRDGNAVQIEDGHTVPLVQDAHYYFYRMSEALLHPLALTTAVVANEPALDRVLVDPSPLHDALHLITLVFELLSFHGKQMRMNTFSLCS